MRVAIIQLSAGSDIARNVDKALRNVRKAVAGGAKFILLPELFVYRGQLSQNNVLKHLAQPIPSLQLKPFQRLAQNSRVFILAGSWYEKAKGTNKAYNTAVLINPQGKIQVKYRKQNLFNAVLGRKKLNESARFLPGKDFVVANVDGFKTGLTVCYDLRFPLLYRELAQRGAQILCVPSNFTRKTGQAHWEVLLRARAIENQCYVLAPNQIGTDSRGVASYGNSMIIDPWGRILARASGNKEEIIYTDIKRNVFNEARSILPGIRN